MKLPGCRMAFNSMHEGQMHIVRRTVHSSDVDASRVPSGLHAHESTVLSCPVIGTDGWSCLPRHQAHFEPSFHELNGIL
jgi:hypothetical protein